MNLKQKLYDLQNQLKEKSAAVSAFIEKGQLDAEYEAAEQVCKDLEKQINAVKAQIAREESFAPSAETAKKSAGLDPVYEAGLFKGLKQSTVKAFAGSIRKAMNEGTGSAGGYTVPEDIVTRIYELIEVEESFANYISTENVRTDSGARTYKTRAQHTGFTSVNEGARIGQISGPTFARLTYNCTKKGGILPATNELLEDSDEDIARIIMEWMAAEARATMNTNVVALATSGNAVAVSGLDDILDILTVGLGSALRRISTIHTNDSGLQWLLTLKDQNGRSLLAPNPTQPTQMVLAVGAVTVPIVVWSNDTLPNGEDDDAIPFLIGSLKEGIQRFDRRNLTVARSTEASITVTDGEGETSTLSAFENDLTLFRGTLRDDYKIRDAAAFKYATFTPDPTE